MQSVLNQQPYLNRVPTGEEVSFEQELIGKCFMEFTYPISELNDMQSLYGLQFTYFIKSRFQHILANQG